MAPVVGLAASLHNNIEGATQHSAADGRRARMKLFQDLITGAGSLRVAGRARAGFTRSGMCRIICLVT